MPEFLKQPSPAPDDIAADVSAVVAEILAAVRDEGLEGIRHYSRQFDNWSPQSFRVAAADIDRAPEEIDGDLRGQIDFAIEQVRTFAQLQRATLTAHDVENLWVWDSSVFPSSAAVNPALTIAASALRIAAHGELTA